MLKPVNNHLLIEPVKHEGFVSTDKGTYEEIGVVVNVPSPTIIASDPICMPFIAAKIGDKVYFDSWLAAKFPKEKDGEFYWLVKWEDVRMVETNEENEIPK